MLVSFIHRAGPMMASYRYRAAIPATALLALGHTTYVNEGESDVYIFPKPVEDDVTLAKRAKEFGARVIADIGDDHFDHPTWGSIYRRMIETADRVVCPTPVMAERIRDKTGRAVDCVIPDPYEEAAQSPHAEEGKRLLWIGHPSNLQEIIPWMPHLKSQQLRLVTGPNNYAYPYQQWSAAVQTVAFKDANLVLLPSRAGVEYKSANRLVNSIRAGCFPICAEHPAYREFRKLVWVGNFTTGLKWAQHYHADLNGLISEGQSYITKFSPEAIGTLWDQVLRSV